jgi:hypothetical protein
MLEMKGKANQRITHKMLMDCNIDLVRDMAECINCVEPGPERFTMLDRMAAYVYPKPKVVEVSATEGHKMTMTIGG